MNRFRHVEYEGTGKSNSCNDSLEECLSIAYRGDRIQVDMFETPPELPAMLPRSPLFNHVCQRNARRQTVSEQALS